MARWIPITVDDLKDQKLAALVKALQEKALGEGQTDPTPRTTQAVINRIRRKIASCRKNRLDADETTIPAGLKEMAVDFIYADMKGRLEEPLTDDERRALDRWTADLNRIAACVDVVEQPDNPIDAPVQSTSGTPSIGDVQRRPRRVHS